MQPDNDGRATRAYIHTENLKENLKLVKSLLNKDTKICAAVKADAYGHGAVEIARILLNTGADCLGVSSVYEGGELREAGIEAPIILFGHAEEKEIESIYSWDIQPFAGSFTYLRALERTGKKMNRSILVHLKIDTGMGRIGCPPDEAPSLAEYISGSPFLKLQGTCTHFPVADGTSEEDRNFTAEQIRVFKEAVESIRQRGIDPGIVHAANSGAVAAWPEAHFDMVRPGIILYGYYPDPEMERPVKLLPVMELASSLCFIKKVPGNTSISYGRTWRAETETFIGTVPAGYADGYSRLLSNRSEVLIGEKRYSLAGRVCMDQMMIDLGLEKPEEFKIGDKAVLFGPDSRGPDAEELAGILETISYEITCAVSRRVPRIYI